VLNTSHKTYLRLALTLALLALVSVIAFVYKSTPAPVTEKVEANAATTEPRVRGRDLAAPPFDAPTPTPTAAPPGTLLLSAERGGAWEIYAARPDGAWSQVTDGLTPAQAPALSADGAQLAFQSHKDGNWEIYVQQLASGRVTRLTNNLAYDGAPTWSPDGKFLAFESYRAGDLDIWRMNADGSNPVNLTASEPAYDYGPAWSPQGNWIAYTSWSTGHKQLFLVSPDGQQHVNLSQNPFDEEQPAWSPDGKQIAFVSNREDCARPSDPVAIYDCQRREIYVADFSGTQLSNVRQLTFDGRAGAPVWSPDGNFVAFVSPRLDRQPLYWIPARGGTPRPLGSQAVWVGSAAWSATGAPTAVSPRALDPLYVEQPIAAPADAGHPYAMREMKQIYLAPSWGLLSSAVSNSFLALRDRVKQESGNDFLGVLSDMTRQLTYKCGVSCDNLSWHKSGRAVDTRLEYYDSSGRSLLEIVREDELGETYWRLYVRAAAQDGTMGEPLKDAPWDFSNRARTVLGPEEGGIEAPLPYGYYVDFTEFAREYGWVRISAHDDPDFNWRSNLLATEYWHYQKTDGLNWYDALLQVYSPSDLAYNLDWNDVEQNWGEEAMRIFFKNIPPPPSAWKWFALLPKY
jgi:TolB protein